MSRTLITNARLVNEGAVIEADLLIDGERIAQIGGDISAKPPIDVIDAKGRYLIPGMIDDQVHFREPGLTHKGDLTTESRAAVAGGITSFMDMPNVNPLTTTRAALADKYALAEGRCHGNYAFYLGATNDNLAELAALQPGEACGIKAFMGASTGDLLVDDVDALDAMFREAPVLVVTHCEDSPIIWANEAAAREKYGDAVPMREHPAIRSDESCYKSSTLATGLARKHDARLHVLHLTTAREMELFTPGPHTDKRITAEVCVHHLWFAADDYDALGARIKCNPAIKYDTDRAALHQALANDQLDIIATDHAPHTADEKAAESYFKTPAGLPLVQHAVLSLLEFVREGRYSIEFVVKKTAHAVADVFGVVDRGYLREGYYADLLLVDLDTPTDVRDDNVFYKCGWTPFAGTQFGASIAQTYVNGVCVWRDGAHTDVPIAGKRLEINGAR
ncbi:MAG: dihydroorotase [Pseudomonadota bacterium]